MTETVIRRARPEDSGSIDQLFRQMLCTIYGTSEAEGYKPGRLSAFLTAGEDVIYLAEAAGTAVAFLSIEVHREREEPFCYLDDFSVAPGYRSQGIGTKLLSLAEQYAKQRHIGLMALHVEIENERARQLYARRGYQTAERQGSRLQMRKRLSKELCRRG